MIDCYCCERREVPGVLAVACQCNNCFCIECLYCNQHCTCVGGVQLLPSDAPDRPWFDPQDYYPGADAPTVIPG